MARTMVRFSLAAAAVSTVAASVDELALLQSGATVGRADACKCLSWKDVYANHGVECGQGPELTFAGGYRAKPMVGEEFCTKWYERISGNFCTQLHFGEQRDEQWCYVSSECQAATVGGTVGDVKWKLCKPDADTMLGQMSPQQLHEIAVTENKDPGLVFKMAYPVVKKDNEVQNWPGAKACLKRPNGRKCETIKAAQDFGKPLIFDSKDGHPPFGAIIGRKAYESHFTPWFYQTFLDQTTLWKSPFKMNEYTCVHGCSR
uniref:Subtilisin n=1 Tax=Alexandrium catenella TaxID=2925 RepID=A0A7S1PVR3_ALECA|mmetsp:Transcript_113363/g.301232  ORF Transcript_113363/g.301232 Transcript_113363/m.301232 type:complete len:260 (+) Transcript_113363:79-858(+)